MGDLVYLAIISNPNLTKDQKAREKEYKEYVDEHVSNVKTAWELMKSSTDTMNYINSIDDSVFIIVDNLISAHDMSKYGIDEWEPYRKNFYPIDEDEKEENISDFEKAWEHHYMNNLHHWDYWARTNSIDRMPFEFVIEMCCDWIAMSIKFGGTAYSWYKKQKDIVLGKKQKEWVENILKKFYNIK